MGALEKAVPIATLVFVVSSMLAMGLGLKVPQVTAPLRNLRLVLLSVLANFVLMPAGAVLLARLLRLEEPLGVGLLLLGAAAGAPFLPKLTQIAKGNLAFAVALMVLLMVITVGYLPLVLPILLPGVSVNPARIAGSLVVLMLLPWAVALAVNAKLPGAAARAKPLFDRLSSLGLILVVVLLVVVNFNKVLSVFGTRAILAGLLFIVLGLCRGMGARRPGDGHAARLGLGDGAAQHCRGARGGRPKLQRPQCRRHGGRRRDRQSPDTPADVTAARQERLALVTAQAARGARLPAGLLRQGRRELSVLLITTVIRMPAPTFDRRPLRRRCAVLVAVLTVVLSGCAAVDSKDSTELPVSVFESAPCPSPNYPGHPELDLGSEFSCGFLSVPENRANPGGRKIKIAVARARAQSPNPRPDPLVYLTGGPGGTAIASAAPLVQLGINHDRDVIFVDQRGTLHADPLLSCPEIDQFMDDSAGMSVQAQSTADKDLDAVRACRTRLASDGYDLSAYNTTENAADIADLRTALKIDNWHVYGVSYGSDLALQLLRDHPEGIRSVVLDSVVPPQTNAMTQWWPSAAAGYRALFDACAAQQGCAAAYPELSQEFTTAVQRLAKAPLSVDVPPTGAQPGRRVVIDSYTLAGRLPDPLRRRDAAADVHRLIVRRFLCSVGSTATAFCASNATVLELVQRHQLVLTDAGQRVFSRHGSPPVPLVPLIPDHNLRNTRQIDSAFQLLVDHPMRFLGGEGSLLYRDTPCSWVMLGPVISSRLNCEATWNKAPASSGSACTLVIAFFIAVTDDRHHRHDHTSSDGELAEFPTPAATFVPT